MHPSVDNFLKWTNSTILLQYTNAIGNDVKTLAVGWRLPYVSPRGSYWIRPDLAGIIVGFIVSGPKAVGQAFTVKYRPCGSVKGTVGDFLDEVPAGHVVVLDNGGRTYATVWGDIMTVYSQKRGIAGTVKDGVCRDLPGMPGDIMVCHDTGVVVVPVDRAGEV